MRTLTPVAILLITYGLYTNWDDITGSGLQKNDLGFSPVIMPDGAHPNDIIIYISPGHSDRDRRGRALFEQLNAQNLPVKTSARYLVAHQNGSKDFDKKNQRYF